ncbi:MAG TPA: SRPBCC family protein [Alphaproteobacteria bacterium]|jgi:uncharacterized protein YndB with AHSA1/START domain
MTEETGPFTAAATPIAERELSLTRLIDVPRAKLFRCWSEPDLIKQWFCPRPWTTPVVEMDFRSGGTSYILMRGPNGEEIPNHGVYLEVVRDERIVFTDAFTKPWEPSNKPFFVGSIAFADEGGKTRYDAKVQHWTVTDRDTHEKMGFHEGWGIATDQLAALAKTL